MRRRPRKEVVAGLLRPGRFVLTLGGEHSIAPGPIRAHHAKHPKMSVLHFDAHGDLRDEYEGQKNSHACAAHRWVELGIPSVHVGIRSISKEEIDYVRKSGTMIVSNREMHRSDAWMEKAMARLTGRGLRDLRRGFLRRLAGARAPGPRSRAAEPTTRPCRSSGGSRRRSKSSAPTWSSTPRWPEIGRPTS